MTDSERKAGSHRSKLLEDEQRRARQLRVLSDLTASVLRQDSTLNLAEARQIILQARQAALRLFPGKETTFDLILLPRFERILYERWGSGMTDSIH